MPSVGTRSARTLLECDTAHAARASDRVLFEIGPNFAVQSPQNKGVGCVSIRRLLFCRIQGDSKSGAGIQGECNERLSASSGRKHLDFASAAPQNLSDLTPNLHGSTLRLASLAQCKLRSEVKYPELVEGQQNI